MSATHDLQVGGTLEPGRHVYITRPDDQQAFDLLLAGEYCNILTSRQMGKSSLMAQLGRRLDERRVRVALVDLQDLGTPPSLDDWYLGLLFRIARDLEVKVDVRQWWSSSHWPTPNQRLIAFFQEIIAPRIESPIVIFLDEIDQTLKLPYTDDFFVAIRSLYNQRGKEPAFARITFCLVGVASPNELIKDKRTTPYNIGRTIELRDFDSDRDDLSELHRAVCPDDAARGAAIVTAVIGWTGGHPYLTASLCRRFAKNPDASVDELVQREFVRHDVIPEDEKVHFGRVTEYLRERACDPISTLQLYRRIRRGRPEPDRSSQQHIDLKLSGIVKRDRQGRLVVRNRIYERIFTDEWARATMPPADLRVKFARRAAVVALAAMLLIAVLAGWQWDRNQDQRAANGVLAVLDAAPDRLFQQIEIVRPVRSRAIPIFRAAVEDPTKDQRQRLHAALALGKLVQSPTDVPVEFLVEAIPTVSSREIDNLLTVLSPVKEIALPKIRRRFEQANAPAKLEPFTINTELKSFDSTESAIHIPAPVYFAIIALHLGDYEPAKTLSRLDADPTRRTAFIHGFAAWHGRMDDLIPVVQGLDETRADEADFRSALCSALGLIPLDETQPSREELGKVLQRWYREAPDGPTHSAASWALRKSGLAPEPLATESTAARDWFDVDVVRSEVPARGDRLTMIKIPRGKFFMGSEKGDLDEKPVHEVELTHDFYLSDREVTVGMFKAFMARADDAEKPADWEGANERVSPTSDCPVQQVSWTDAVQFCNWLSREQNRTRCYSQDENGDWQCDFAADGFRLPTEAEWEYACRARAQTEFAFGDDESFLGEYAVFGLNASSRTRPAGAKLPNGFGLFDLHGNVWEWCADGYDEEFYKTASEENPLSAAEPGRPRVLRGGSWSFEPWNARSAFRLRFSAGNRDSRIGFRFARTP